MQLKYLPQIKSPKDLKELDNNSLHRLCDELRYYTVNTITQIGGHLAPTLGVIELTTALHYIYNTPDDKLVWDVGHQAYAHKLLTGRFDEFPSIRQYGGLSGFLKRSESEYDVFGAGHASTAISAALGMAEARYQKEEKNRVVAVIGDGAMTGGLAFEAINNAGHLGRQITVILNDNEMSISPNVGAISKYFTRLISNPTYNRLKTDAWELTKKLPLARGTIQAFLSRLDKSIKNIIVPGMLFEEMGFRYFGPIDGHDLDELIKTLDTIKDIEKPVLLHVITKKGKGMSLAEDDPVKYHGVKANGKSNGSAKKIIKQSEIPSFQDAFGYLSCEIAENRKDTVCITAAMREGTGLVPFEKKFPDRYYDVGIAEGHAVTFSAGLATQGIRPIVAIYSTFLQRAFDHIVHDVSVQNLPVIFCMDRSGIAGEDGPTHHGALDIAYLKCVQDLIVSSPRNGNELRNLLYTALEYKDGPFAIRYPKASSEEFDQNLQGELLPIGSWEVLQNGNDVAILAVGPLTYLALEAAEELKKLDISCEVVNCRFIKPMDENYLEFMLEKFSSVLTIEEGVKSGGFGEGVLSWLSSNNYKGNSSIISLPDRFVEHGPRDLLLEKWGINKEQIIKTVTSFKSSLKTEF